MRNWDSYLKKNAAHFVSDLIDFVVARILDQLNIKHNQGKRWTGEEVDMN